jgi:phosphoglycerate dehydrogenase-like enzyme
MEHFVRRWVLTAACAGLLGAGSAAGPGGRPQPGDGERAEDFASLRHARVAYPMEAGRREPLTYLAAGLTAEQLAELAEAAPNVRVVSCAGRAEALEHAPEAQGADGRLISAEFMARSPGLVWVQCPSAGVEWLLGIEPLATSDRVVLTNMRAAHAPAIADHAFAMLLTLTRGMRALEAGREEHRWVEEVEPRPVALAGRTMLVVGLGGIGGEIAQRAHGFGMRVIARSVSLLPGIPAGSSGPGRSRR